MQTYHQQLKEIEDELYAAIEALERGDIIGVRQCSARAQTGAVAAWQAQRHTEENDNINV